MKEDPQLSWEIPPVEPPVMIDDRMLSFDPNVDRLLWVPQARQAFGVTGEGLTVAVLDTGLNTQHVDFAGRIVAQRNFTQDNEGNTDDATDGNGHGTNVGGIIVANGLTQGIAPSANIIPLKILPDKGAGDFQWIDQALQWTIEHCEKYQISVVSMSLGDSGNYTKDNFELDLVRNSIREKIKRLRQTNVAVVVAAGNDYFTFQSQQGMSFPAIVRECISVGAVYDLAGEGFSYQSGAVAYSTKPDQITPFSQRLHETINSDIYTCVFAPGAPIVSSGINGAETLSIQHGTSQATPVVSGLILLIQEFYRRITHELPPVDALINCLREGGIPIFDGEDLDDNVRHTNLTFLRADALSALNAIRRYLQV